MTCGAVPGPVWEVDCRRIGKRAALLLVGRWSLRTEEVGLHGGLILTQDPQSSQ